MRADQDHPKIKIPQADAESNGRVAFLPIAWEHASEPAPELFPAFKENNVPVVVSIDNNYAPYCGVALQSLIDHSSPANNYDIVILCDEIDPKNVDRLLDMRRPNVSIRFEPIARHIESLRSDLFRHDVYPAAAYFRFFIPRIFRNFAKVLYLDIDTVILADVADLYGRDLGGRPIGAVRDFEIRRMLFLERFSGGGSLWRDYLKNVLGMRDPSAYVQSGVLLFDTRKLAAFGYEEKCLETLARVKKPICADQCIINSVMEGRIAPLPDEWNVEWTMTQPEYLCVPRVKQQTADDFADYSRALADPKLFHFCSRLKPWRTPWRRYADLFWKYARMTPFYEEIVFDNLLRAAGDAAAKKVMRRRYKRYKLLQALTFGAVKKFRMKKNDYKRRMQDNG